MVAVLHCDGRILAANLMQTYVRPCSEDLYRKRDDMKIDVAAIGYEVNALNLPKAQENSDGPKRLVS